MSVRSETLEIFSNLMFILTSLQYHIPALKPRPLTRPPGMGGLSIGSWRVIESNFLPRSKRSENVIDRSAPCYLPDGNISPD